MAVTNDDTGQAATPDPLNVTQGGTGADMSATGGTGHVVFQASVGADFTTGTIAAANLGNNVVTDAVLRDSAALSVIGRSANTTGDPADIAAGTSGQVLRRSGTALGFGAVALNVAAAVTGSLPVANGGTGGTTSTGSGAVVLATSPSVTGLNVTDGLIQVKSMGATCFLIEFSDASGAQVQHRIISDSVGAVASSFVGRITGASASLANTPLVAAGVDFASGVGIDAAQTNRIVFNTAAQAAADTFCCAIVGYDNSGSSFARANIEMRSLNVNGTTRTRLQVGMYDSAGATVAISTATIGAGKSLLVRVIGFVL